MFVGRPAPESPLPRSLTNVTWMRSPGRTCSVGPTSAAGLSAGASRFLYVNGSALSGEPETSIVRRLALSSTLSVPRPPAPCAPDRFA